MPIEEIKKKLPSHIKINENTYVRKKVKCLFYDEVYGEWWSTPDNVLSGKDHPKRAKEKYKETCFKNYGVDHPTKSKEIRKKTEKTCLSRYGVRVSSQNLEVAKKNARSQNKSVKKIHWKTGEDIFCVASYEAAVVDYLNENKIGYLWQPEIFTTDKNKRYIPDLYLIAENKWVEVKGYFRKDAKEKWDWFHATHPNSELWNKEVLKSMKLKIK